MATLHTKYRPATFKEVLGQGSIVNSLQKTLERGTSHAFLFCGPSGVGKTTLARISAYEVGCADKDVTEVDAATYTGVDAMRQVQDLLQYRPFGESDAKAVIIDEAHALSRQAWQSLLKAVEEPPAHVYWFFCTTEAGKVPPTIKTRCATFTLREVGIPDLTRLIERVCKKEGIDLASGVLDLILREAHGSPRQALLNLTTTMDAKDRKEARDLLRSAQGSDVVLELCRFVVSGGSWAKVMGIMNRLENESAESVRIAICNYLAAALRASKTDKDACYLLAVLENFSTPYNASEQLAPLYLSIGRTVFSPE